MAQKLEIIASTNYMAHLPAPIVESNIIKATTIAEPLVTAYTTPADAVFTVSGFVNITAVTLGVISLKCSYTDINNNAHSFTLISLTGQVSNVGTYNFNNITLNAKGGTTVTIYTELSNPVGLTYDVGGIIQGI